ncbi:hypothetical protein ACFFJB_13485 [Camelimonas abortus]
MQVYEKYIETRRSPAGATVVRGGRRLPAQRAGALRRQYFSLDPF